MSNAAFLLIAIGLSVVLSTLVWLFNRKPKTFMSSIDDFSREMKALGREPEAPPTRRRKRTAHPASPAPVEHEHDASGPTGTPGPTEERRP